MSIHITQEVHYSRPRAAWNTTWSLTATSSHSTSASMTRITTTWAHRYQISTYLHTIYTHIYTLSLQDYSVCIRRNSGMCRVAYKPADDGESFYTSQKPTTPAIRYRIMTSYYIYNPICSPGPRRGRRGVLLTISIFRMAATGGG